MLRIVGVITLMFIAGFHANAETVGIQQCINEVEAKWSKNLPREEIPDNEPVIRHSQGSGNSLFYPNTV